MANTWFLRNQTTVEVSTLTIKAHIVLLMIVADPCYNIIYMNVGCNGRVSDGGVFFQSSLFSALENNSINIPRPCPLPGSSISLPFVIVRGAH